MYLRKFIFETQILLQIKRVGRPSNTLQYIIVPIDYGYTRVTNKHCFVCVYLYNIISEKKVILIATRHGAVRILTILSTISVNGHVMMNLTKAWLMDVIFNYACLTVKT